jgi:hypothetical protein
LLHITNGDCAVTVLSQTVSGTFLPWRDVLHEGPVRAGLSLEDLSAERARFIADAFRLPLRDAEQNFRARDAAFRAARQHDEIVLWFEHDLYDQLQLIQVLDALGERPGPPVSLVCEAEYLGMMAPERAAELFSLRNPVTRRHVAEASRAWAAFRSPDPRELEKVKAAALGFVEPALRRHLQEFPWTTDFLSRLERSIVQSLPGRFDAIFAAVREEPAFLGDAVLLWHLRRMEEDGLVAHLGDIWTLAGPRKKRVPRWLGGCEIKDETVRWDPALGRLV